MLTICYGRENVDKDRYLFDRLAEDALLIVPDQYTLEAEKDIIEALGRKGLLGMEVLSFSRLGSRILQEAGGGRRPMIDRYGRHMLLGRIVRRHENDLKLYGRYGENTSFLSMLNDMISQMKQYGATPEVLGEAIEAMPEDHGHLRQKLTELKLVYEEYEKAIDGKYVDTEDLIGLYCERLPQCEDFTGRQVVIFGFDYFTPGNLRMIGELMKVSREMLVMLSLDDREEGDLFALGGMMRKRLADMAKDAGIPCRTEQVPDSYSLAARRKPALMFLESQLFAMSPGTSDDHEGIELVRAANYYSEAATAAQRIRKLVQEEGYRYRDIVLICNDLTTRGSIIRRVFKGYGMDVFLDQKRDVLASPAVSYILALFAIVTRGWRRRDVIALLKTGLTDMASADVSRFENYCEHYRIDGKRFQEPFVKGVTDLGEEDLAELESLRASLAGPLAVFAEDFKNAQTVREKASVLFAYLQEKSQLPAHMESLVQEQFDAGDGDLAQETAQIWNIAMEILDQIVAITGDDRIGMANFADTFRAGIEAVEVGVLPPTMDGLVMGTMQRTRTGRVRALFVLGANEGILPADVRSQDVLTEDEKTYLMDRDVLLCKMDRLRVMEENLAIYRDMAHADELLYISCAATDQEGGAISPSPVYDTIRQMYPGIREQQDVENRGSFLDLVGGERSTLEHLGRYFKQKIEEDAQIAEPLDPAAAEALLWYREHRPEEAARIEQAVGYQNIAEPVGPETAMALYAHAWAQAEDADDILSVSPSRLEKYGGCPFAHFVKYGLRPEEPKDYAVRAFDMGDVYHWALKELAQRLTKEGVAITDEASPWMTTSQEDRDRMMDEILTERFHEFREGLLEAGKAEQYRADRLRFLCKTAGKVMVEQVRKGAIEGMAYEMPFGRGKEIPPVHIRTKDGIDVLVEGTIDRVDYLPGGKVKVIDYKSEKKKYKEEEAKAGTQLQLFLYLAAASQGLEDGSAKREPVGAFYFPVDAPLMNGKDIPAKARADEESIVKDLEKKIRRQLRMNGFMLEREDVVASIEGELDEEGKGTVVPITHVKGDPKKGKEERLQGGAELHLLRQEDFDALLASVAGRVQEMADDLAAGHIEIAPRRTDHEKSSCTYCDYKGICKFDTTFPECKYVHIHKEKKEDAPQEADN